MTDSPIILKEFDQNQKIYVLTLNRPKQLNAMSETMLREFRQALESLSNKDIGALIINSSLERAFCTGIDVKNVQGFSNEEAANFFAELAETFEQLSAFSSPTIAVINGYAFGAGADLALACDLRVAGHSARFRFPGPQFGVVLGTHRLANEVGPSTARKLALTNQIIGVDEALQYGLVHEATEDEASFEKALELARNLIHVPKYTFKSIQEICAQPNKERTPMDYAKQSILQGDFQVRFSQYLKNMKERKK